MMNPLRFDEFSTGRHSSVQSHPMSVFSLFLGCLLEIRISENLNFRGIPFTGPMAKCPIGAPLKAGQPGHPGFAKLGPPLPSTASSTDPPEPFESNKISIFYLTRKGSGQASDSNSIPHALSESMGMQTVPYPAIGYPYNPTKPEF